MTGDLPVFVFLARTNSKDVYSGVILLSCYRIFMTRLLETIHDDVDNASRVEIIKRKELHVYQMASLS